MPLSFFQSVYLMARAGEWHSLALFLQLAFDPPPPADDEEFDALLAEIEDAASRVPSVN